MAANLIAKQEVEIQAPRSRVWQSLTDPSMIREYFFGSEAVSDWNEGSTIEFRGEWEGKPYADKGTILRSEPEKLLQYSYFSPFYGREDVPENYTNITYELFGEGERTILRVRQENLDNDEQRKQSEDNWKVVLENLKELLENENTLAWKQ